ncbi:MAG TPA: rhodanese-like domain-containing protein [Balneolales bacterium]|nr:rhodanese-like domain-containing protein [Balneolales bacterium]
MAFLTSLFNKLKSGPGMNIEEITCEELNDKIQNGEKPFILDVRQPNEYRVGNIGGKLIPLNELPRRIQEIEQYKDHEIIVHCRSGARSARACQILQNHGFSNPKNLAGGILAWANVVDQSVNV